MSQGSKKKFKNITDIVEANHSDQEVWRNNMDTIEKKF